MMVRTICLVQAQGEMCEKGEMGGAGVCFLSYF